MKVLIRTLFLGALAVGLFAAAPLVDPQNKNGKGLALRGYDAVAYFAAGAPTKGNPAISHSWNGATWLFASEANRDAFAVAPEKYAPQYGGYCAYAVSKGYTADANPEKWKIVDGKLYVNYNGIAQGRWQKDIPKNIELGDRNWPTLHK